MIDVSRVVGSYNRVSDGAREGQAMELSKLQIEILRSVKALQDGERIDLNTGRPIRLEVVPRGLIVAELWDREDLESPTTGDVREAFNWLIQEGYLAQGTAYLDHTEGFHVNP